MRKSDRRDPDLAWKLLGQLEPLLDVFGSDDWESLEWLRNPYEPEGPGEYLNRLARETRQLQGSKRP